MKLHRTRALGAIALGAVCALAGCNRGPSSAGEPRNSDQDRAGEELSDAAVVVREMSESSPIPRTQRERARCIVVVPSMVRAGFVVGAQHGHGVVTCRKAGGWSAPAFITIAGGSAGLQVGVESSDLVMLVVSERAMGHLFQESFQLGIDASAAAGPVGEAAQASTDATLTAEILSYARSRGLFAGIELSGAVVKQDRRASAALYGKSAGTREILTGDWSPTREAAGFLEQVRRAFPAAPETSRLNQPPPSLASDGPPRREP